MKKSLAFVLSLTIVWTSNGQERKTCATDGVNQEAIRNNPCIASATGSTGTIHFQLHPQSWRSCTSDGTILYVIPVVFHIVHNYGPENISDEQIIDAVRIPEPGLPKDNADTVDVVPAFHQ